MSFVRLLLASRQAGRSGFDVDKDFVVHRLYVADLLTYIMDKNRYVLTIRHPGHTSQNSRRFQAIMGDAVLLYQDRNEGELDGYVKMSLASCNIDKIADKKLNRSLIQIAELIFKGENFVKEFFVYSAFLAQLALFFADNDQEQNLKMMVNALDDVYNVFWKKRFYVLGGWHELHRYAIQYLKYE